MRSLKSLAIGSMICCATPLFAASRGTLLSYDFETGPSWPQRPTAGAGTIDVEHGTVGSNAVVLAIETGVANDKWSAALDSGPLAIRNDESNLGKLTLAFMLSASSARPVKVYVTSFDAEKRRTGALVGTVYPAAPDFYQRYALDLSTMTPDGDGAFAPTAPFVSIAFEIAAADGWPTNVKNEVRVDNVQYARPAFYVSPTGDDSRDGLTEATAFATPQKAVDSAEPGDIIVLMDGTWPTGKSHVGISKGGTPAAWLSIKNYPGARPTLENEEWNCIVVGTGKKETPSAGPAIGYVEVRGLHVRGIGDVADKKYAALINEPDARTNGNAMSVEGRYEAHAPHHIRFADNLCEFNCGAGPNAIEGDWITIENNVVRDNCWWMIYAGSGISILGASNFDGPTTGYRHLIRDNTVSGNHCNLMWKSFGRYSDGNGIILDVNKHTSTKRNDVKFGRTLVQGNVSFNNGGSGIHAFSADNVDIINNTAYLNSASPHLQYAQIYAGSSKGSRIMNNVLVAPVANVAAGEKAEPVNANYGKDVLYANNIYFGGNRPPFMGPGDRVAEPMFVNASTQPATADFHLRPGSPAIGAGGAQAFGPIRDHEGKRLPTTGPVDAGAYQH